jgi:hypothetical protein
MTEAFQAASRRLRLPELCGSLFSSSAWPNRQAGRADPAPRKMRVCGLRFGEDLLACASGLVPLKSWYRAFAQSGNASLLQSGHGWFEVANGCQRLIRLEPDAASW